MTTLKKNIRDHKVLKNKFTYCMRAMGNIKGMSDTNALESFHYWYDRGMRIFEVDIDLAADDVYVLCHELTEKTMKKFGLSNIPEKITSIWFVNQKIYKKETGGLTPLTVAKLLDIAEEHPDVFFMIDPRIYSYEGTVKFLTFLTEATANRKEIRERLFFETYNSEMIRATREFKGVAIYQYCIGDDLPLFIEEAGLDIWDMRDKGIEEIMTYLRKNEIYVVSYPWKVAVEHLQDLKKLTESPDFIVFSKTRNDVILNMVKKTGVNVNILQEKVSLIERLRLLPFFLRYYLKYRNKMKIFN